MDSRTMKYRGMSPREGGEYNTNVAKARRRHGGTTRGRVNDRMAGIILCDRCGSISTERVAGSIDFLPNPNAEEVQAGLCRSEERRVGKECVSTCRSRWSRYP